MSEIYENTDASSSNTDGQYVSAERALDYGKFLHTRRGDSADEVDPRKLVRDPTLSEIRWYYRRTFASVIVDKPVDDAFKNGYEMEGSDASWAEDLIHRLDWDGKYKLAKKKARRDGFCTVFIGTLDNTAGIHTSLSNARVQSITHLKVFSIDDLHHCAPGDIQNVVKEQFGLTTEQFQVRRTGIVINTDPTSKDYRNPIGYVISQEGDPTFIHRDRMIHLTENETVDGDYYNDSTRFSVKRWGEERVLGQWEGDSVLIRSYDLFKGIAKGNWAIMQALFRNASMMYAVHLPADADEEDYSNAVSSFQSMNSKSEFILPRGEHERDEYKIDQYETEAVMEPREHFDVVFDQICANHEMTKSVLFGTQTGVVSGSETDIKNYFNQVSRMQSGSMQNDYMTFLNRAKMIMDGRVKNKEVNVDMTWKPLFKVSDEDQFGMFLNTANSLTTMINGYMLTPDEARSILSEKWSEWDIDLNDLNEEQRDLLDRINLVQVGAHEGATISEEESGNQKGNGTTSQQRSGGMKQGQQTGGLANTGDSTTNNTDSRTTDGNRDAADVSDDVIDAIADRVLERIDDKLNNTD